MPLYEYLCRGCAARFERLAAMREADAATCPRCGGADARRLVSVIGGLGGTPEPQAQGPGCGAGACGNC